MKSDFASLAERPSQQTQSLVRLISGCWNALKGERRRFFLFASCFVLAYTAELAVPWAIGYTISVFVRDGFTHQAYRMASLGIFGYFLLRLVNTVLHHLGRYIQYQTAYSAKMEELQRVFALLLSYRLHWHVHSHSGENLAKLQRAALAVNNVVGQYSWQIIDGVVKVSLASIALFALDGWVATNVVLTSIATVFIMAYFNRRMAGGLKRNYRFENKINRLCVDYLTNMVTVKTLALETYAKRHMGSQKGEGAALARTISKFSELKWGAINAGYALVISSSLLIYFWRRGYNPAPLDVAPVYVLISYLDKIFAAISSFTAYYGGVVEAYTSYEDVSELEHDLTIQENFRARTSPISDWSRVAIRNLEFSYVAGSHGISDIEFEFRRGERIALIGQSGGGKSTLLKILGGMIPPERCLLHLDHINSSRSLEILAGQTLLIPQEPQIFTETLLWNITMGEHFSSAELAQVSTLCQLEPLIAKLPKAWDTNLAESGLNLSGGEKQRVALARGLLRATKKSIILLDEPTSSLDPKTERQLLNQIFYHYAGRTILLSCHRLNLLPLFDKVLHIESGRIVHSGTPSDFIHTARSSDQARAAVELSGLHLVKAG